MTSEGFKLRYFGEGNLKKEIDIKVCLHAISYYILMRYRSILRGNVRICASKKALGGKATKNIFIHVVLH